MEEVRRLIDGKIVRFAPSHLGPWLAVWIEQVANTYLGNVLWEGA